MAKISNISLDSISRDECTAFSRAALLATTVSSTLASITPAAKRITKTIFLKTITFR